MGTLERRDTPVLVATDLFLYVWNFEKDIIFFFFSFLSKEEIIFLNPLICDAAGIRCWDLVLTLQSYNN